ncbi:hypothetical protein FACS189430_12470 [Bacteroidia bacterium]|nr:hypothetical protein FACS189430_12470 [Bacteroidia bacterium]
MYRLNLSIKTLAAVFMMSAAVVATSCSKDKDKEEPTDPTVAISSVALDKTSLTLVVGGDYTLTATVLPENATDKTIAWKSSDNSKATVANGKVIAIAAGEATITVTAGDKTATCKVNINDPRTTDAGVIINGVKWATRNIDEPGKFAVSAESTGKLYQWNRKKAWDAVTVNVTGWDDTVPAGTSWATANDPSPEGWRVPTPAEMQSLCDAAKVTNEWLTSPVNGLRFTDKASGITLFLPAAGYRGYSDGTLYGAGTYGNYWSSTANGTTSAYGLYFFSGDAYVGYYDRRYGFFVRSVAE